MPIRLKAPLTRPVTIRSAPSRPLLTFLDAIAYLHEREREGSCPRANEVVDLLMLAAASEDSVQMTDATDALEQLVAS